MRGKKKKKKKKERKKYENDGVKMVENTRGPNDETRDRLEQEKIQKEEEASFRYFL